MHSPPDPPYLRLRPPTPRPRAAGRSGAETTPSKTGDERERDEALERESRKPSRALMLPTKVLLAIMLFKLSQFYAVCVALLGSLSRHYLRFAFISSLAAGTCPSKATLFGTFLELTWYCMRWGALLAAVEKANA